MNKEAALQLAVQIDTTKDIKQIFEMAEQILNFVNSASAADSPIKTTDDFVADLEETNKLIAENLATLEILQAPEMFARMQEVNSSKSKIHTSKKLYENGPVFDLNNPKQPPKNILEIAETISITNVNGDPIVFTPDQYEVLNFLNSNKSGIVATNRQFGKTTLAVLFALNILMNTSKHLYVCVNNYSMLMEFKRRLEEYAAQYVVTLKRDNKTFSNEITGGTVEFVIPESLNYTTVKPDAIFLVDEAAYISFKHENNVYGFSAALGGRTIYMSTPNSLDSQFTKLALLHAPLQGQHIDVIVKYRTMNDLYDNKPELFNWASDADVDQQYTLETFRKHIGIA